MSLKRIASTADGYPFALFLVVAVSLVLLPFRALLQATTVMLLFVPVIIVVGRFAGARPSALSALLAFLALDLLFVPPYYHFNVASVPEWLGLLVFLSVALVSGQQTAVMRQREQAALARQRELELLNRLSLHIASEKSVRATAEFIASQVTEVLGAERVALYVESGAAQGPRLLSQAGDPKPASGEGALVSWVLRTSKAVGMRFGEGVPVDERVVSVDRDAAVPGVTADGVYLPLQTSTSLEGVLYARIPRISAPTLDDARLLTAVANLAASAIERQRLGEDAAHAEALREADRLKATLVSSVSHELKTPLAAATARVTGLIEEGEACDPARIREELGEVADDLVRLNASIGDLLDLSRLESDAWQPCFEPCDVTDVLGTLLSRLPASSRERVRFELAERLPYVDADFAQLARAIGHIIENALAYSPAGSKVTVGATARGDSLQLWVADRGPGVAPFEKQRVFEKFYRGEAAISAPTGTGLGLAIAREIVDAHGGTLAVEDVAPHGARFVMNLPVRVPEESQ
jgi:two-component system, OmpR family, sensor histidine kinase KdpD